MKRLTVLVTALLLLTLARSVWARGGGGCWEAGTPILTPTGPVPIEHLAAGDAVWNVGEGQLRRATVQAVIEVVPDEYLELSVGGRVLRVTAEHPLQIAAGMFRAASRLGDGDTLVVWDGNRLQDAAVQSVRRVPANQPAYNLLVSPGGTYLAGGVVAHNKGCFLPDTPILRPDGTTVAISRLQPGDRVLAFSPDGQMVPTTVNRILTHEVEEYLVVRTEQAVLRVTVEHPFYVGDGTFQTLEALRVGDPVFAYDGTGLSAQRIVGIERVHARTQVFNLQTDAPNTFFAHGIAVHNKGGGCFPAGTMIQTASGATRIERLQPGDTVIGVNANGRFVPTVVEAVYAERSPLLILETESGTLRTTAEHPVRVADGGFELAGRLVAGQSVLANQRGRLRPVTITSRRETDEPVEVFNLRVGPPHTFVADGFVAHNKGGGCFPAGTPIQTPRGEIPIEKLTVGDTVWAIGDRGRLVAVTVDGIRATRSALLVMTTENGAVLRVTAEHPLRLAGGSFCPAEQLRPDQRVVFWQAGRLVRVRVQALVSQTGEEPVYNLQVGEPHTFIAGGFVVHNKGGGGFGGGGYHGGGYHGGSGGSGDPRVFFIVVGLVILVIIIVKAAQARQTEDENLDFVYSIPDVARKAEKTRKLLEFIARTDPVFALAALQQRATETFVKLQECWQSREYEPMRPLLMPDLYAEHCGQLAGLRRHHEINRIEDLHVDRLDIVNVRYTHQENQREFTALITASARDYYVDDRTQSFLRGDDSPAQFQEFWTFHRQDGGWVLREIEQSRESDKLREENFFEQFTDQGVAQVYGETAGQAGPAGPWLEKETETKATRTERLLNFLVQTDKLWDRPAMIERARQVFTDVLLARESGDITQVPEADLFPAVATDLRQEISRRRSDGTTIEFRNLCVRKVELILVRNYSDNAKDEFTVRISAHAQRVVRRNGAAVSQEEYVTPFVEYWTFGRLDGQWKLKEVLPPSQGEGLITQENLDQDSSPEQLQWYYRHTRAG